MKEKECQLFWSMYNGFMIHELALALNKHPNYLYFMVTSRCNASCDFCWNHVNVSDAGIGLSLDSPVKRKELTLEEIDKFTKKLPEMLLVDLYGGEPFLRNDFDKIVDLFVKNTKVKYISIPTNGFYVEKTLKDVELFLTKHVNTFFRMCVSIDGPKVVHDRVRKVKNGYENAIATAKGLSKLKEKYPNISLALNANYNSLTAKTMKSFVKEMFDLEIFDSIDVGVIRGKPRDLNLLEVDLSDYEEIQRVVRDCTRLALKKHSRLESAINERAAKLQLESLKPHERRVFKCYAVKKISVVSDEGDVFPCEEMLNNSLGNLRDFNYDLEEILRAPRAKEIAKSIEKRECDCAWECAMSTSSVFDPIAYPGLLWDVVRKWTR